MKRVLIKGFYGNDNLGDDFILYSLLDTISSAGSFKVTVIYNEKKNYDELFSKYSDLKCRYLHGSHKRILSKLLSLLVCDYWIIGGGGLFPSEKNAEISKLYRQIRLARIFKTKVCLYGIDINSIDMPESIKYWRLISQYVDFILVRNSKSYDMLKKIGCKNIFRASDITFGVHKPEDRDRDASLLKSLNIENGKYNLWAIMKPKFSPDKYNERYDRLIRDLITISQNKYLNKYVNVYMPFYYDRDIEIIKDIVDSSPYNSIICDKNKNLSLYEKRLLFKYSNYNISMRFHGAMFSIYYENPGLIISYSEKTSSVVREYGLKDHLVEYGINKDYDFYSEFDLDMAKIEQAIDKTFDDRDEEVIHKASYELKKDADAAKSILKQWLLAD